MSIPIPCASEGPESMHSVVRGTPGRKPKVKPGLEVFTTGQVAKICNVTIRTVIKWFESGKIQGYRIPGSRDRRIPRENLLAFLEEHGIPYDPSLFDAKPKILVAEDDPAVSRTVIELLSQLEGVEVHGASNGYEAGFLTAQLRPRILLIDYDLGDTNAEEVVFTLERQHQLQDVHVIVMSGFLDRDGCERLEGKGLRVLRKPFDVEAFLAAIRALIPVA